jgi:hypothetical protein
MFRFIRQLVQKLKKDTKVETQHPSSHSNGNTLVVRSPKLIRLVECQNKVSYVNDTNGKWLLYNPS